MVAAWTRDTLLIYDANKMALRRAIPVSRPKFYFWVDNGNLALSYQTETQAAKAIYARPIVTRCVLDTLGRLRVVKCDTSFDTRNALTHLTQLSSGEVGSFQLSSGKRIEFHRLLGDSFTIASADTVREVACRERTPEAVHVLRPSNNCRQFVVYLAGETIAIVDELGRNKAIIGPRFQRLNESRFGLLEYFGWSFDDLLLGFVKYTEDGHRTYASDLFVYEVASGELLVVSHLEGGGLLDWVWSPTSSAIAVSADGRVSLWQTEIR